MLDVVFVLVVLAFFGVAYAYIAACSWIVGKDDTGAVGERGETEPVAEVAA